MTQRGLNLIKEFEGCKLEAYLCPSGVPTIGIGATYYKDGRKVQLGDRITQKEADELFKFMIENKFEPQVRMILGEELNAILPKECKDALVSFCYNCGTGAFSKSTLLKKIRADKNDLVSIKNEFLKWNKSNGKVLNGLTRRRNAEFELYLEGISSQYTKRELIKMYLGI
jgi:lysozyme